MKKIFLTFLASIGVLGAMNANALSYTVSDLNEALQFAFQIGMTQYDTIESFQPNQPITREEAAKMYVAFDEFYNDKNVPLYEDSDCNFTDINKANPDLQGDITTACEYGIFKGNNGEFRPKDTLTLAEAVTAYMRITESTHIPEGNPWRVNYAQVALDDGLITEADLSVMDQPADRGDVIYLGYEISQGLTTQDPSTVTRDSELQNTSWILKEYNETAPTGDYILSFTDDRVNVKFCNTMGGEWSTSGDTLNATLISTQMYCFNDEAMTLENNFDLVNATYRDDGSQNLGIMTKESNIYLRERRDADDHAPIGGDKDSHGCYTSAGYSRDETLQQCIRPREV